MATSSFLPKYAPVPATDGAEEPFLSPGSESIVVLPMRGMSRWVVALLLVVSSICTTAVGFGLARRWAEPRDLDDTCTRHTTKYSPILDEVHISYSTVQFDGRFVQENIYRQDAGPDVDAAWEALGVGYRPIMVSDSLAAKSGLNKNHARRNPSLGGGYPVFVEGLHQLHCLNLLRKSLYYNYDYYKTRGQDAFGDPDHVLRWHVSHCLDILRQRLQCTVDTGVFGSVWVGNYSDPRLIVDFNTRHVCRNFDAVRSWVEQNQIPEDAQKHRGDWQVPHPGDGIKIWEFSP